MQAIQNLKYGVPGMAWVRPAWVAGLIFGWAHYAQAQHPTFEKDVYPILEKRCLACHGEDVQESHLRLDTVGGLARGGSLYPQLVSPGDAAGSHLYRIVAGKDHDLQMPPEGEAFNASELATLESWILHLNPEELASLSIPESKPLWSIGPLMPSEIPIQPGANHPVDAFIGQQLQMRGLDFSPPASRRQLIQRLYLVVLGLPPTASEIEAFVQEEAADAYEKLVTKVLNSHHFGENWAKHWLDVVRFAESDGFETNHERPTAWRYRDYVIECFNQDKSYYQFVAEQIAGDQLGEDVATGFLVGGPVDIVKGQDDDLNRIQRQNELADMVGTTSTTFLGMTLGCARCHQHKFDPLTQYDYYALQAVFAGVQHGEREIPNDDQHDRQLGIRFLETELNCIDEILSHYVRPEVSAQDNLEDFASVPCRFIRFSIQGTNGGQPCIDELEIFGQFQSGNLAHKRRGVKLSSSGDYVGDPQHRLAHLNDGVYGNSASWIADREKDCWVQIEFPEAEWVSKVVWSRDRRKSPQRFQDRLPNKYSIAISLDGKTWREVAHGKDRLNSPDLLTRLRTKEQPISGPTGELLSWQLRRRAEIHAEIARLKQKPRAYAGRFENPGKTFRLHRGEPHAIREEVAPQVPGIFRERWGGLSVDDTSTDAERRLAFAKWLSDPTIPITNRVMVNRIWQGVFGKGIVASPSDFGNLGSPPTHPELLDYLAREFQQNGGSIKELLHLLLTSRTFQQSSKPHEKGLEKDAQGDLYWRFRPRRLDGELIRDRILFAAGTLDLTPFGTGFLLFQPNDNYARNWVAKEEFTQTEYRRMIYATKLRMAGDAVFSVFDLPDGGQICPVRPNSTTPIQALNLFNSKFVWQQAEMLTEKISETASQLDEKVKLSFRQILGRHPDQQELVWARSLVQTHGVQALVRALFNTNEFLYIE